MKFLGILFHIKHLFINSLFIFMSCFNHGGMLNNDFKKSEIMDNLYLEFIGDNFFIENFSKESNFIEIKATVKTLKETVEFEGPPKTIEWHVNDYLFRNGHQIEDVIKIIRASDASRLIPE